MCIRDRYVKELFGDRIIDKFQDAFVEAIRRINASFITSDRIARRTHGMFLILNWAAVNTALPEIPFFVCPYDLTVKSVKWHAQGSTAVNTVDYREMSIRRRRAGVLAGTVATRNTGTNGNAIAAYVPWTLVLSSDSNITKCKEGDVLCIEMPEFGNGPAIGPG